MPSDGKSSHCLCQGELKINSNFHFEDFWMSKYNNFPQLDLHEVHDRKKNFSQILILSEKSIKNYPDIVKVSL
jgi:hypothetical protein